MRIGRQCWQAQQVHGRAPVAQSGIGASLRRRKKKKRRYCGTGRRPFPQAPRIAAESLAEVSQRVAGICVPIPDMHAQESVSDRLDILPGFHALDAP